MISTMRRYVKEERVKSQKAKVKSQKWKSARSSIMGRQALRGTT